MVGIDDWAFRRGHCYGTLVYDFKQQRVISLPSHCEGGTIEVWLCAHPAIAVSMHDRGCCYGEATTRALLRSAIAGA